jgi:hypothetical protein
MKKFIVLLISVFALALIFNACSKKGADKLVGKWKQDPNAEMEKMGVILDVTYEFSKDNKFSVEPKITHRVDGKDSLMQQPKLEGAYTVKQDNGKDMEIEVTLQTGEKGLFKIVFDSDAHMSMTDPNNMLAKLTKI